MSAQEHWEAIYRRRTADEMSWFRPHLECSLRLIEAAALPRSAAILDAGGGASSLVDDLLERGYSNLFVADLSASALDLARRRLGARAESVTWLVGDVTEVAPEGRIDLWHDRAVFHFLAEEAARSRYVAAVRRALTPGGHLLVATFAPGGPQTCSGLPVVRYGADELQRVFGSGFERIGEAGEIHRTPAGREQPFVYCLCRYRG